MCGRYSCHIPPLVMRRQFRTVNVIPNMRPRYNIGPRQDAPVIRWNPESRERYLDILRWGLVPRWWATDASAGGCRLINVRAEALTDKPSCEEALMRRRCLIPANSFFVWKQDETRKQPYAVGLADDGPMAFAGLWEGQRDLDGDIVRWFTIITTAPNKLVGEFHERMPVMVRPPDYAAWLGEEPADAGRLREIMAPYPSDRMKAWWVSSRVNSLTIDEPELLRPAS
jgi:putative SOS response-associated peptidase YedK